VVGVVVVVVVVVVPGREVGVGVTGVGEALVLGGYMMEGVGHRKQAEAQVEGEGEGGGWQR